MISKKYLKILIISLIVLVILAISLYFIFKGSFSSDVKKPVVENKPQFELMKEEEKATLQLYDKGVYEVVARDSVGHAISYRMTGLEPEKDLAVEYMTDAEMAEKGIYSANKIQVLKRDGQGKVIAYKIVKNESDIVKRY
ncbi:MAG: hypothetical protein ACOYL8_05205 [Patescibacteria group bacterium]